MRKVGLAADHAGFALKAKLAKALEQAGYDTVDFGARRLESGDDYPDYVVPLARAIGGGELERGIAVCGSGVGAAVVANRIAGVRASLIHDVYSAHQGVEDDDMNLIALGGRVIGEALAWELVQIFLGARFRGRRGTGAGSPRWRSWTSFEGRDESASAQDSCSADLFADGVNQVGSHSRQPAE